jgi:uncharacterized protein (TIGR02145 family)
VTTSNISDITQTSVTTGGNVTSDGGEDIIIAGVCWSTSANTSVKDKHTNDSRVVGSFISKLTNLAPNTRYYIRAYAHNKVGTGYGDEISFTTNPLVVASLTTAPVTSVTSVSAISGGNISSDGGTAVTARGVCWSTSTNPTIADPHTIDGTGTGNFTSSLTGLSANTTYYVRAYAANIAGTAYGNEISFTTIPLAEVSLTTAPITSITPNSAISGGNVSSDGGATVTARGVCWSTSANPAITDQRTIDGTGTGSFVSSLTGLTASTTYFVRAYATNIAGTVYGNEVTFETIDVFANCGPVTDIDGNTYNSVTIGTQCWMQENLKTTRYRNGDPIPAGPALVDWYGTSSGAYVVYNNDNINNEKFGKLYNWYAVADSRHLCPTGWHAPTDAEWTILETYLTDNGFGFGGSGNDFAKSVAAASGWSESSLTGSVGNDQTSNNSSGFTALPGGCFHYRDLFDYIGTIGFWWSSSEGEPGTNNAWSRYLQNDSFTLINTQYDKHKGLSVRCIKD